MAWCCERFWLIIDKDIEKGISVFASKEYEKDMFILQACPFDKEVVAEFNEIDPETGFTRCPEIKMLNGKIIPVTIGMVMKITNCMFCGKKLSKVIKKNQKEFDLLAEKHLELLEKYFNEPREKNVE